MMHPILGKILEGIEAGDPAYGQKLRTRLSGMDGSYLDSAAEYFTRYNAALEQAGQSIDFGIACYLKLAEDMTAERFAFLRTGKYSNRSYKDVEQRIYANPAVMDYHMHGLALAQYLWPEQYERIEFFRKNLAAFTGKCRRYLEVGGGHGLYVLTALKLLPETAKVDLLDISPSSIKLAKQVVGSSRVNYRLNDIFEYESPQPYDFITAGEIIEHLEDPLSFLRKVSTLLKDDGVIYFTTSVNAPMIDHIFLFNNVQEIREMLAAARLAIILEKTVASRDLPEKVVAQQKLPVMYAAFLRKV